MKQVTIAAVGMEAVSGTPLVVLRESDEPHRLLPIFVGAPEAAAIALGVSGQEMPRPLTHDLMAALVDTLDGHLDAVEVTDLRDGSFVANLTLRGPVGERRLDTRPSDAIALAVRLGAPLFVADEVLDEAGSVPVEESDDEVLDQEDIDRAVEDFRAFLDEVDPTQFDDTGSTPSTGDEPHDEDPTD
ncbi:MAG: bifunctional nuclease family protein [Ilumatobacteraceae bacterium]